VVVGLLERGYEVAILHRGVHEPAGLPPVRHIHADPHFAETLVHALGDEKFDTTNGLLARVIGEWTSQARLCRLLTRLRAPVHPYDELTLTGTVGSLGDGRAELAVRAATRAGVHADAVAIVSLPAEASGGR
jgi:hypothetical protein